MRQETRRQIGRKGKHTLLEGLREKDRKMDRIRIVRKAFRVLQRQDGAALVSADSKA